MPRRPLPCGVFLIAVCAAAAAARVGRAEDPAEIDPTGGLRGRGIVGASPTSGISREELVRQWDLDGNGTIDASEAAVARARMKRSRLEMESGVGIDPLTGKPRAAGDGAAQDPADEASPAADDDLPPAPRSRAADTLAPPGTRVPAVKSVVGGTISPQVSGSAAPGLAAPRAKPGVSRPAPGPSWSGLRTGGVRAGAPAARSGYGSFAPRPDLNAGVPRPPFGRPVLSGTRASNSRGGFLPTTRSPAVPRPVTPAPAPAPSRVTADEIGGY